MSGPTGTVNSWWRDIQRLHDAIVAHWVRCRTARQPFALQDEELATLLKTLGIADLDCPPPAEHAQRETLSGISKQLAWGLGKINQFQSITQAHEETLGDIAQRWLARLRTHWVVPLTPQALAEFATATRTYVEQVESVCLDPNGPRPVSEEYSAEVQLQVLHLTPAEISEPILDIGCGKEANLVHWLRSQRMNAVGVDRFGDPSRGCIVMDWFEFPFVPDYFGTIIAHLSYSLHFLRHHLAPDGQAERFAKQYMSILRSLRVGGRMVYAPGLPFIERLLPPSRYAVTRYPIQHFAADSQAAELYAQQLGENPIYACHVQRR